MKRQNVIRVFLSSSFQDMHAERDYLMRHVFPVLDQELRARGWRLQALDLRGSTAGIAAFEEEAVLRMCLDGVQACKPWLIGLLGERYGWIPFPSTENGPPPSQEDPQRQRLALVRENLCAHPALQLSREDLQDISVTHLEIRFGLRTMDPDKALFYLRTGIPDAILQAEGMLSGQDRQQQLKAELSQRFSGEAASQVKAYTVAWDAHRHCVTGLESLGNMMLADLRERIARHLEEASQEKEGPTEKVFSHFADLSAHRARWPEVDAIVAHAQGVGEEDILVLSGPSGYGKTTRIAQAIEALQETDVLVLAHAGAQGPESFRMESMLSGFCRQLQAAMQRMGLPIPQDLLEQADALAGRRFPRWIRMVVPHRAVALFVDDLDQMERTEDLLYGHWISPDPVQNVRYVLSATPNTLMLQRPWRTLPVGPTADRSLLRQIAAAAASAYGKTLADEILDITVEKALQAAGSPLYVATVVDDIMNMTGEDYRAYQGADAYLQWMRNEVRQMPVNQEGAYRTIVSRTAVGYGEALTHAVLHVLAATRTGARQADLEPLLAQWLGEPVAQSRLFAMKGFLQPHLRKDPAGETWQFAHRQLRSFCRSLMDPQRWQRVQACWVDHLCQLSLQDPYREEAFLWHCCEADRAQTAARELCLESPTTPLRVLRLADRFVELLDIPATEPLDAEAGRQRASDFLRDFLLHCGAFENGWWLIGNLVDVLAARFRQRLLDLQVYERVLVAGAQAILAHCANESHGEAPAMPLAQKHWTRNVLHLFLLALGHASEEEWAGVVRRTPLGPGGETLIDRALQQLLWLLEEDLPPMPPAEGVDGPETDSWVHATGEETVRMRISTRTLHLSRSAAKLPTREATALLSQQVEDIERLAREGQLSRWMALSLMATAEAELASLLEETDILKANEIIRSALTHLAEARERSKQAGDRPRIRDEQNAIVRKQFEDVMILARLQRTVGNTQGAIGSCQSAQMLLVEAEAEANASAQSDLGLTQVELHNRSLMVLAQMAEICYEIGHDQSARPMVREFLQEARTLQRFNTDSRLERLIGRGVQLMRDLDRSQGEEPADTSDAGGEDGAPFLLTLVEERLLEAAKRNRRGAVSDEVAILLSLIPLLARYRQEGGDMGVNHAHEGALFVLDSVLRLWKDVLGTMGPEGPDAQKVSFLEYALDQLEPVFSWMLAFPPETDTPEQWRNLLEGTREMVHVFSCLGKDSTQAERACARLVQKLSGT